MKEKKEIKVSLGTVILMVIIIILLCIIGFLYLKNKEYKSQGQNLNNGIELNAKVNEISSNNAKLKTIKSNTENNEEVQQAELIDYKTYKIDIDSFEAENKVERFGDYTICFIDSENVTFNDGWGTTGTGTYKIKNQSIECEFTDWYSEAGGVFRFKTEPVRLSFVIESKSIIVANGVSGKGKVTEIIEDKIGNFARKDVDYTQNEAMNNNAKFIKQD